jgi:hypothetical protein
MSTFEIAMYLRSLASSFFGSAFIFGLRDETANYSSALSYVAALRPGNDTKQTGHSL